MKSNIVFVTKDVQFYANKGFTLIFSYLTPVDYKIRVKKGMILRLRRGGLKDGGITLQCDELEYDIDNLNYKSLFSLLRSKKLGIISE